MNFEFWKKTRKKSHLMVKSLLKLYLLFGWLITFNLLYIIIMRNKWIKKSTNTWIIIHCRLNTSRYTILSVLRVSLCVAYGVTRGKKAVQNFIHEVSQRANLLDIFSHKSFAYSVKIMSVSKKTTYFRCFRYAVDSESVRRLAIATAPLSSCCTGFIARSFIRA